MTEFEELRELYLNHLAELIPNNFKLKPRARHPQSYRAIPTPAEVRSLSKFRCVWVWSDLHFGHTNVIKYSDRPYQDVHHMNESMILNHNLLVNPADAVITVGDVAFMNDTVANTYVDRLNGYKILIVGNHDMNKKKVRKLNFNEVHLLYHLPAHNIVFTHYPIIKGLPEKYLNVHGHVHKGKHQFESPQHFNVNLEFLQYRPIPLENITDISR